MNIEPLIQAYLAQLRDRGLASRTLQGCRQELHQFSRFVEGEIQPETLRSQILAFLEKPRADGQPIRPGSKNRKQVILRGFCAFLVEQDHLESNPVLGLSWARLPRPERPFLTLEDYQALLATLGQEKSSWLRTRDRAILKTLFFTGIRVSELVGLTLGQVDLAAGLLGDFRRKGGTIQTLPIASALGVELSAWLKVRKERKPKTDHLFVNRSGGPLGVRQVQRKLQALGRKAGLKIPVAPHGLRHLHASVLVRQGVNLETIRVLLAHRSITTTTRYTHVEFETLRQAVEKLTNGG